MSQGDVPEVKHTVGSAPAGGVAMGSPFRRYFVGNATVGGTSVDGTLKEMAVWEVPNSLSDLILTKMSFFLFSEDYLQ